MPFFPQFSNLFVAPFIPIPLDAGLLAYWKLDTTEWIDSTGNGNTLTANGAVSIVSGKINNCANFDGNNDEQVFMWLSRSNFFNFLLSNFSISQWIYFNSSGANYYQALFTTRPDGGPTENSFNYGTDLNNVLGYYDGVETGNIYTFNPSTWYHLVAVRDGTNISFYVNGSYITTAQQTNPFENQFIAMGGQYNGDEPLNGRIDEVGFWNRALTGAEITSLYNAGAGKTYPFN
jgi:hypothetical protein